MTKLDFKDKQVLIFDLDGTLIDSVPDLANSVNFALQINQLPTHDENTIRLFVGNGAYKLCERACPVGSDGELIDKVYGDFLRSYAQYPCVKTTLYAGVAEYLPRLAERYRLAMATNKPVQFLPAILAKFAWGEMFDVVLGGDSLPDKKPNPAQLLHICTKLGVTTTQAVMIGDSKNDILAGQNAGMTTLALSYGYNYGEPIENSKPDATFADFESLAMALLKA